MKLFRKKQGYFLLMICFLAVCTSKKNKEEAKVGEVFVDKKSQAKKPIVPTRIDTVKYSAKDSVLYALIPPIKSGLWDTLRDIKHTKEGAFGYIPVFTEKHKALHGKKIKIQGYMHPLEADKLQKWFMLSYYPTYACFFCGASGPETIVEVKSPKGVLYQQDKIYTLRGTIYLNRDEPERLFYILEEARLD